MPSQILSIQNVVVATGIAYDAQIAAANSLLFPAVIDNVDRTRPMLSTYAGGGAPGSGNPAFDKYGVPHRVLQNKIDGDPATVRSFNTRFGVVYVLANSWGDIVPGANPLDRTPPATSTSDPRYYYPQPSQNPGDPAGTVYYVPFIRIELDGRILGGNNNVTSGTSPTLAYANDPNIATNSSYLPKDGLLTFKPLEGAALAAKNDELSRMGQVVSTLSRLLDALREQDSSFRNILR